MKLVCFNIHNPDSYNFSMSSVTLRWPVSSLAAHCLPVVNEILPIAWHKSALPCKLCFLTLGSRFISINLMTQARHE